MPERPSKWHPGVLPVAWSRAKDDLARRSLLDGFYLAGGTGMALQYGHRRSADLDLFRETEFDSGDFSNRLRGQEGLERLAVERGTAHMTLHGLKVSFLHYPYPLLFPLATFEGLPVADTRDIACMKIQAIGDRGSRRDFVDLYVVAREHGLGELFMLFMKKYASVAYSRTHYLKALTYFRDAEEDALPEMLQPLQWSTVTQFFLSETPRLARLH